RLRGPAASSVRSPLPAGRRGVHGFGLAGAGGGPVCHREDSMKRPVIEVRDLGFRYGDGAAALNGVNFRLEEGECVAMLGPNGSGKTTFVLHLNGLLEGQGSVEVCGLPVERRNLPAIRRKIGLVFQD